MRLSPLLALLLLTGCRPPQRYIQATVSNRSGHTLHTLELDYPSASFGTQTLENDADFHYRILIQGPSTPAKFSFLDPADPAPHAFKSSFSLKAGDGGSLTVTIDPANRVTWTNALTSTPSN